VAPSLDTPSSCAISHIVDSVPLYGPTSTIVCSPFPLPTYFDDDTTDICPRRRTVSIGSFTNSSTVEVQKVAMENVIGVRTGSIASRERSSRDIDCVIRGDIMLWRIVGMARDGGHE